MRPRLPPVSSYVEQMSEGVLKPETWAAMDDPFDQESDDEAAEEFQHMWVHRMWRDRGWGRDRDRDRGRDREGIGNAEHDHDGFDLLDWKGCVGMVWNCNF